MSTTATTLEAAAPAQEHPNQFALLRQRRFAPFFWTQFAGAANDNLFKFAFTVMVTYQLQVGWLPPALAGLVIGALFILPFLLFSATSGQLADKYDKRTLIRFVKSLEIAIMVLASIGFFAALASALILSLLVRMVAIDVQTALLSIVTAGISAALIAFAALERTSMHDG